MSRRQHIDDLNDTRRPRAAGALARRARGRLRLADELDADDGPDRRCALVESASPTGEPRRLTNGPADSSPAWSPDGTSVAFLRAGRRPAADLAPAGRRRRAGAADRRCRSAPARPSGAPTARGSRSPLRRPAAHRGERGRPSRPRPAPSSPSASTTRPTARATCAASASTSSSSSVETEECRQVTRGDWHAGEPAWSPDGEAARVRGGDGARRATWPPRAVLRRTVDADRPTAEPELAGLADGGRRHRQLDADGSALLAVAFEPGRAGRARAPAARPARRRRSRRSRGAARPQRDARRPRLPGRPAAARRRRLGSSVLRPRPRLHPPLRGRRDRRRAAPARRRPGTRRQRRSRSPVADRRDRARRRRRRSARSSSSTWRRARRPCAPSTGETPAELELFAREEREFTISDGTVVQGWLMRDPEAPTPAAAPARHPRRAAQRLERRRRRLAPLPPGARGARLDGAAAEPARQRRVRRGLLPGGSRAWGEADAKDFLEPIDAARRRGHRRPGAARGHRLQLRRLHDVLPDEPRRALRRGGRRRRRQRPRQHGRHLRRRATTCAELELGGEPWWDARDRYERCRRSPASTPSTRRRSSTTARPTSLPGRPGAAVAHGAARARRPDAARPLPGRVAPVRPRRAPVAPRDFNRRVVDWVEQYAGAAAASRPRLDDGALAAPARRAGRAPPRSRRERSASCACGPGATTSCVELAYGLLNKETGVETTARLGVPDRLDDEGLDGDRRHAARRRGQARSRRARSRTCCPSCELADRRRRRRRVTMRHLLTHTSGIDGDVFTDTGRGDDCLERYVGAARRRPRRTIRSARPGRTATPASRSRAA